MMRYAALRILVTALGGATDSSRSSDIGFGCSNIWVFARLITQLGIVQVKVKQDILHRCVRHGLNYSWTRPVDLPPATLVLS